MNIRQLVTKRPTTKILTNTTWQRSLAAVVYFLLFTFLLSSGLFVSKLHLEVGQPSPQLIRAPWEKTIDNIDKYLEDQEEAARAVQPVYKPDEEFLTSVARDLSTAFLALRDALNTSNAETKVKVAKLRQTSPFAVLSEETLLNLLEVSPELLNEKEQKAGEIILGNARSTDNGARSQAKATELRSLIKEEIDDADFSEDFKGFLQAFVDTKITQPTLIEDTDATERLRQAARATVRLEVYYYKAEQKIVGPGDIVDEEIMQVLQGYGLVENRSPWRAVGGIAIIVAACILSTALYTYQYRRNMAEITKKLYLIGLVVTLVLLIGKAAVALNLGGAEYNSLVGILIPVAWATMTIAILVDAQLAFLISVILAIFVGVLVDPLLTTTYGVQVGLVAFFGGIVGVHSVSQLSQRSDLARAGLYIAAVNVFMVGGIALISGMGLAAWLVSLLLAIVNGLASSVLAVGTLHWFESGFHITSAVRLLELSNPNRPLLKKLLMEAPGTYHHSILVGNLAEAAAEAVQANAILVRVGALYHDIGKLKRPYFFIENQFAQENPHDKIAPTLSALIITSHIKDGLEMAKEHKLPQAIQDIIAQHHGDGIVSFFYHKAVEDNLDVPEEAFHYEGPKPQSKEAALVLLADSVEAAVRAMKQPTPGRIEGLVRKIIKDKLYDDQLNQCDLTFQDLDKIATAFVRVLSGIFHSRVEYPNIPDKQGGHHAVKTLAPLGDVTDEQENLDNDEESYDEAEVPEEPGVLMGGDTLGIQQPDTSVTGKKNKKAEETPADNS